MTKKTNQQWMHEIFFFTFLFSTVFILFKRAFDVRFILDDFIFLKLGKLQSLNDFFHIFSPFKTFFYRPIPTEIFYYFISKVGNNLFISHLVVFILYCVGIFFLYKCLVIVSKKRDLSLLITFLYAIHFTHVFQLYELATFIEISLFLFFILSTYFYLKNKLLLSLLFFTCALLSKETAIFLPVFFIAMHIFSIWKIPSKKIEVFLPYILLSVLAFALYRPSVTYLQNTEPLYAVHLSPRLIGNNLMWYSLWSLGFPNFLPDYITSIFSKPLPKFWTLFSDLTIKTYFFSIIAYYVILIPTAAALLVSHFKQVKKILFISLFLIGSFLLFITPTLPTLHKWMVRLTLPLIFVVIAQGVIMYFAFSKKSLWSVFSVVLLSLYVLIQISGIPVHEKSSVYFLQSTISQKMQQYCAVNKDKMRSKSSLYFIDKTNRGLWGGSEMLRNTLHESDFIDALCPQTVEKAYFNYRDKTIPQNSYIIDSAEIIFGE